MLKGKNILLGVGGSISAYKAPELVRLLQKEGAHVQVMMSKAAREFVTPLTLEVLSGNPVLTDMFAKEQVMPHIHASRKADLVLIAPATANMLARFANGMADDLIAATVLGSVCPVLIAPAMNVQMWKNFLVQENCRKLLKAGYHFAEPGEGELACGEYGEGRLMDFGLLLDEVKKNLTVKDLQDKKVLITEGATREYMDPVRFLSNGSSGKMGLALAKEAYYRGADVTVVHSVMDVCLPASVRMISVISADEMEEVVMKNVLSADVFIANAAVGDYRFSLVAEHKIKKDEQEVSIHLLKNTDILAKVGLLKKKPFVVGFALESNNHLKNGFAKLSAKNADLLVVNDVVTVGSDLISAHILARGKRNPLKKVAKVSKVSAARTLFDLIVKSIR